MITETIHSCYLCGNNELISDRLVEDHYGSGERFQLTRCKVCDTIYTNPRPSKDKIITYYKSNSYVSHGDKINPIFDTIYKSVQSLNFRSKRGILEKYTLAKNHLDYGCGSGAFLNYLTKHKWNVEGVEPDSTARAFAQEKYQLNILPDTDSIDPQTNFSSISLFHVLEHVHDLENTLNDLINQLDENGILLLALPNFHSNDAQHYQEYWAGYDVPRHLYHFSQKSIHQLSKTFGLNIVATHPMKFDSYYVSLLSEQYKTGSKKYLSAFRRGYISNRMAKRNGEFSSLIYILSK
ncbi:class I SAM-dependent methyltransferase [Roseivirga misakiensis]|uniref:Methyltransferase n=1 Tax=Roseivirga misakiensis TaxID=1563681 RepID=A0A1E5T6S1_9BACT|nr:class I SAM-dependent methyltransferase [Roseivirga misakiensis]OEK07085.1 hypothetical protein BFP71_05350 [Roseivirga misakiensis]